jgi:hypothetical protein
MLPMTKAYRVHCVRQHEIASCHRKRLAERGISEHLQWRLEWRTISSGLFHSSGNCVLLHHVTEIAQSVTVCLDGGIQELFYSWQGRDVCLLQIGTEAPTLLFSGYQGSFQSLIPSSIEIKNEWSYTFTSS